MSQQEFPGMTLLLMVQEDKSMREPIYFCNIVADIYTNVAEPIKVWLTQKKNKGTRENRLPFLPNIKGRA